MKTIKDYLDSLFLHVPVTAETKKAKEDLLSIMEDHYYELIEAGKSENEAIGAVISEFGSIDELLAELDLDKEDFVKQGVELDEAFDYWDSNRSFAFALSAGILCCCLALAAMGIVDTSFENLAILLFFLLVAVGIGCIISGSLKYSKAMGKINNRPLKKEVINEATERLTAYEKSFRIGLSSGIGLCILAIPLTVIFSESNANDAIGISTFFGTAGIGTFLIIYVSLIYSGFKKMTHNKNTDNHSNHEEQEDPFSITTFKRLYWPCVLVLYFITSTLTFSWGFSWLIFIIAAPLRHVILDWLYHQENL